MRELNIAYKLRHPNIVNMRDVVFDEPEYVILVSDLADGGTLHDTAKAGPLAEEAAQFLFKQVIAGVEYCHRQGVVHRDLKLENLLITATGQVKVSDFGMSKDTSVNSMPKTQVGTISYMAPEVTMINKRGSGVQDYGSAADLWSIGVILYVLVCGTYPFGFDGPSAQGGIPTFRVYERIRSGAVDFPSTLSLEILELLRGLLTTTPEARWQIEQIKACNFFTGGKFYVPPPVVEIELGTPSQWPLDPSPGVSGGLSSPSTGRWPDSIDDVDLRNEFGVSPRSIGRSVGEDDMGSMGSYFGGSSAGLGMGSFGLGNSLNDHFSMGSSDMAGLVSSADAAGNLPVGGTLKGGKVAHHGETTVDDDDECFLMENVDSPKAADAREQQEQGVFRVAAPAPHPYDYA